MRYYGFTNMYLSSIQVGIQNAHCLVDMSRKYHDSYHGIDSDKRNDYAEWADNHKTMVCLNGGNQKDLNQLAWHFSNSHNQYAWEMFFEDNDSLNDCLTCVGIILPEHIYEAARVVRERVYFIDQLPQALEFANCNLSNWDLELITMLNNYRLAN